MFHTGNYNENLLETFESFPCIIPKNMIGFTIKIDIQISSVIKYSEVDRLVLLESFLYYFLTMVLHEKII